jgi:hypothetical protein
LLDFAKLRFPQPSLPDFFMAIVPTLFLIQILKFCIPPICHFSEVATFPEYVVLAMPLSGHCHRSSKLPLFW